MSVQRMLRLASLPVAMGLTVWLSSHGMAAQDGAITIVLSEEPDIIDPCESSRSNVGRVVKQNITETLTEIDPKDGTITPRLATEWQQIDDLTWRFKLRESVTFQDGEPFNAEAVKTAIERTLDDRIDCEIRIKFFGGMEVTPVVVDEHTIDIKTAKPAPIMPTMMGTMTITSPNTVMGERTRDPVGTGPYKFDHWDVGQEIVLTRFDDYWGEQPDVEKVTYVFRTESAVRAAMVATGEADIAPNIAVQDATDPKMDFSYLNSETSRLRIDVNKPPLDDIRVRKALNLGFDRDAMIGTIFSKDVIPATQLVVPSIPGHNPDLKVWPYDPEQAKQLLEEARADGAPIDNEIVLICRTNIYPNSTEACEAIMAMYQAIGLKIRVEMLDAAAWVDWLTKPFADDRPVNIQQGQHDNNNGDPVFTVFNKYHSEGGQSVLSNPDLDKMIEGAEVATGADRIEKWQAVFAKINDEIIADVPMYHMVGYSRVGPDVDFTPDISSNSELQVAHVKLK
jgi:peptide/nickel transport system substrate-binding protein